MIHEVKIPFSNEAVFEPVAWREWRLRKEVRDWIGEACRGHGWGDKQYSDTPGTGRSHGVTFQFITADQALLFKLTWGGLL